MTDLDLDSIDPRKATPSQVADVIAALREARAEVDRLTGLLAAIAVLPSASKPVRDIARDALLDARPASLISTERSGCSCPGHAFPGVSHIVACCDQPHIDQRFPSATTDGGEAAEALLGIVLAVAFAALLLWRLT